MKTCLKGFLAAATAAFGLMSLSGAVLAGAGHSGGHGKGPDIGKPGKPGEVSRTIEIIALDSVFSVPEIRTRKGETIRFVIRNEGELVHEFNIGTPAMHAAHQREMARMMERGMMSATSLNHGMMAQKDHAKTDMSAQHDDPNSVLIEPGDTAEIIWTFGKSTGIEFACNLPGHYESGMVGPVYLENAPVAEG